MESYLHIQNFVFLSDSRALNSVILKLNCFSLEKNQLMNGIDHLIVYGVWLAEVISSSSCLFPQIKMSALDVPLILSAGDS